MPASWFSSNRLTPPPDGQRTGIVRVDNRVSETTLRGWARENKRDVFLAMKRKVVLPEQYCLRSHQARIDTKPPEPQDPAWRIGPMIDLDSAKPYVLVDFNGVVAAWIFPGFLKEQSLPQIYLDDVTEAVAKQEFPPSKRGKGAIRGAKTNGKARGGEHTYTTSHGIAGTVTYAAAWHQQCHERTRSYAPSKDLSVASTVSQSVHRDLFICSWRDLHWRINNLISLVHPHLHSALSELRAAIADHPSCLKLMSIWESIFPGHSLICNRTTGEHIDKSGIRRGFEVLLANGHFTGGQLYLTDLNVQIAFLPGTLILLDGTAQRHKIQPWSGSQRYSNALFVHRSVLDEHQIPHSLPDVSIHDITARFARTTQVSPVRSPTPIPSNTRTKKRGCDDAQSGSLPCTVRKCL